MALSIDCRVYVWPPHDAEEIPLDPAPGGYTGVSLYAAVMSFWKRLFPGTEHSRITDKEKANSRIVFSTDRSIDLYELEELCDAVGWSRRPLRKVKKAIECSFCVVAMYEEFGERRRLVGFARATSDHAFNATIWDVVVHPDLQGRGMGRGLMDRIVNELRTADISNITLFADPHVIDFYRRLGFICDPEGIKGMFWYPD